MKLPVLFVISLTLPLQGQEAQPPVAPSPVPGASLAANRADLSAMRELMDKRFESQKVLSAEKSEWKLGKEMLQQRIELVGQELADFQKKKTESEKSITDADLKKSELVKNKEGLEASLKELQEMIAKFEAAILPMKALLPSAVIEKVEPLYQRIPEVGKETKVSLAERYQNVIGILNQISKSNQEINIVSEIRTLDDGKPAEVKSIYVGLAQAYYVNATGKKGGYGYPTEKGWEWKEDDSVADEIQTAIGTLESKTKAHFVSVPVQLKN